MKAFYIKEIIEAGVDEAGRGPLLGRVYAAAVVLNPEIPYNDKLIKDSKKISKKGLSISEGYVKKIALDWSVAYSSAKRIDEINILQATQEAMHKAIDNLNVKPEFLLIDGNYFKPYQDVQCNCIIKGDDSYFSIAAASILAKTARDRYIEELCNEDSSLDEKYGIKSNKGYGSSQHMSGIQKYGISEWHRKTFGICKNY